MRVSAGVCKARHTTRECFTTVCCFHCVLTSCCEAAAASVAPCLCARQRSVVHTVARMLLSSTRTRGASDHFAGSVCHCRTGCAPGWLVAAPPGMMAVGLVRSHRRITLPRTRPTVKQLASMDGCFHMMCIRRQRRGHSAPAVPPLAGIVLWPVPCESAVLLIITRACRPPVFCARGGRVREIWLQQSRQGRNTAPHFVRIACLRRLCARRLMDVRAACGAAGACMSGRACWHVLMSTL